MTTEDDRYRIRRLVDERDALRAECDQYQQKLTEVWAEVARLRAYADGHPCDHMPACPALER